MPLVIPCRFAGLFKYTKKYYMVVFERFWRLTRKRPLAIGDGRPEELQVRFESDKEIVLPRNNIMKNGEEDHENCNRLSLGDG
jgi:hypothetical protein